MEFKTIFVLLVLVAQFTLFQFVVGESISNETFSLSHFNYWMKQQQKHYASNDKEISMKHNNFIQNEQYILAHNLQNAPYKLALGKFADLSTDEFQDQYLGFANKSVIECPSALERNDSLLSNITLPLEVDWRKHDAVTAVKNQGQCGSCWAFVATGTVEGAYAIKSGRLVSLSEQELLDCTSFWNYGCDGGSHVEALDWIYRNGGVTMESLYPYNAIKGDCNSEKYDTYTVTVDNYVCIPPNNEALLLEAVASVPVAVAVDASPVDFMLYSSGIITQEFLGLSCGENLTHAMLVVGYGSEDGLDYWILKNSWGTDWGENGYMRLQRNVDIEGKGVCGINRDAAFASTGLSNIVPSSGTLEGGFVSGSPSQSFSNVMLYKLAGLVVIPLGLIV